jgi:hypothetical protein
MIVALRGQAGQLQEFVKMYARPIPGRESGQAEQIQVAQFGYVGGESATRRWPASPHLQALISKTFADAVQSWQGKSSDQYPGYDKMVASILATTPEKIGESGRGFRRSNAPRTWSCQVRTGSSGAARRRDRGLSMADQLRRALEATRTRFPAPSS